LSDNEVCIDVHLLRCYNEDTKGTVVLKVVDLVENEKPPNSGQEQGGFSMLTNLLF